MISRLASAALISLAVAACSGGGASSFDGAALETDDQKASYGIGLNMGSQLIAAADRLDRPALMRGIEDALQENEPALAQEELQTVLQQFGSEIEAAAQAEMEREAEENAIAGERYLAENAQNEGVETTDSGLQYEVLREGEGEMPEAGDRVRLHYRGTLIDGTEFDSSYGGEPAVFGVGQVIPGFSEGIQMMPVGSHYRIVIPSDIGYGPRGSGPIPPNATLIFEIELLEIVDDA